MLKSWPKTAWKIPDIPIQSKYCDFVLHVCKLHQAISHWEKSTAAICMLNLSLYIYIWILFPIYVILSHIAYLNKEWSFSHLIWLNTALNPFSHMQYISHLFTTQHPHTCTHFFVSCLKHEVSSQNKPYCCQPKLNTISNSSEKHSLCDD